MNRLWTLPAVGLSVLVAATVAVAAPAGTLLKGLKLPGALSTLFAANAVGQTSLNGQLAGTPEALLDKVKTTLSAQGYKERSVNTVVGTWGFNLVLDPPAGTTVDGTPAGKTAALVLQSTVLAPGKLNLNVRFEGI
ncbi:hypothetical protein KBY66_09535 [Synechococcus sp. Tobar12-5m-g]|uniref:hypothetical protein n=1 Tax=unclassified Synechococcus TaxID=2626047 RepID=UPI0020CC33F6|nr:MULTISPECIES: hypothetical protein [unclassified Synechococcus]MCP9772868.1 hypothetical protein [Synechococcus sp. Tobar12-5m-g]MCP9873666.1 hypothetical protein [Synechococcus sp. Cruz CV-v-12]